MSWLAQRRALDVATHSTFPEPCSYTPPNADVAVPVVGILRQYYDQEMVEDDLMYTEHAALYEVRKLADEGPWSISSFEDQGVLEFANGESFAIVQSSQTDELLYLYLAPIQRDQ